MDKFIYGISIGLIIGYLVSFFFFEPVSKREYLNHGKEQYLKGYNQYLEDYYIPEIGIKRIIPDKLKNTELKEKFRG